VAASSVAPAASPVRRDPAPRLLSPSAARAAANVAAVGFTLTAGYQVLLALGVVPITMAWGGTQSVLTTRLRLASLAGALLMGLLAYVIRRRAGSHPPLAVKVLTWVITGLLALNAAGNFASRSRGEAVLMGPLTLVLAVSCLLVAASRDASPAGAARASSAGAVDEAGA
jgi:hypothetical protein